MIKITVTDDETGKVFDITLPAQEVVYKRRAGGCCVCDKYIEKQDYPYAWQTEHDTLICRTCLAMIRNK